MCIHIYVYVCFSLFFLVRDMTMCVWFVCVRVRVFVFMHACLHACVCAR